MCLLKYTFKILALLGCWRPDSWSSLHKRVAYHAYSFLIIIIMGSLFLSQIMYLLLKVKNIEDASDNLFMLVAMAFTCCKLLYLLIHRKHIVTLLDILTKKPCKPLKPNEIKIQCKFDRGMTINTLCFLCLGMISCAVVTLTSLWLNFGKRKLTYRAWLPYNYSTTLLYSWTFTHQLIGLTAGGCINIGCDTLICGFLAHICCQIEILAYRLRTNISYSDTLGECVRQHYRIFRLAVIINTKFRVVISVQFIMSTLLICSILCQITSVTSKTQHYEKMMYVACALTDIFLYCWYGNNVKLKSCELADNIFEMEWMTLNKTMTKSLMLIMRRAIVPIQITSAYIIPLNLEAFIGILKTSYSVYSLLQHVKV